MARTKRSKPAWPLRVEVVPYQAQGNAGHPDTPLTSEAMEREVGEQVCLGRVSLVGSDESKASVFVSVQMVRGGLSIRMEQDQTDYANEVSRIVRREFRLAFFENPNRKEN